MNDRTQDFRDEDRPPFQQGLYNAPVAGAVAAQALARPVERFFKNRRASVFKRMGQWKRRLNPFQTVPGKRKGLESRGTRGKRMNGGTDVVKESRKREFRRAHSATDEPLGLEDGRGKTSLREHDRGGQAIWPGADDMRGPPGVSANGNTPRATPAFPASRERGQFAATQEGNRQRRTSASTIPRSRRARADL